MVIMQKRSKRKPTGGRYKKLKVRRKANMGNLPTMTKLGDTKLKKVRTRGGNEKIRILRTDKVNVLDQSTKKFTVATILGTEESPANRNYERRNIITKGATVKTDIGMVKITSRPGQTGTLNGVLIKN